MTTTERAVHPAAAVFPMLSDDELRDLADDIKANGLLHPIIIDAEGAIVDGRNRYAACGIAGVEPRYQVLNGHDPIAFILSQNIARRHLTKGQQAMIVARVLVSDSDKFQDAIAAETGLRQGLISEARIVLTWAPDLVDRVIAGADKYTDALKVARERKAAASSTEAQLRRLRATAPDLATLVVEEQMDLAEALGALRVRQQREVDTKRATSQLADTMLVFLDPGSAATVEERVDQILSTLDPSVLSTKPDFSARRFRRCARVLWQLVERVTIQDLDEEEARRDDDPVSIQRPAR